MRARARTRAHQNVHPEILQRRVEHLFHIRQQAVDFVDEENLARANVAENPGEVEFLLKHRPRGGTERHLQFLPDDGGQRGFAQSRRPVEQHVVHGFAAHAGRLDGDSEVLLQLGLAREIGQTARAEARFEL